MEKMAHLISLKTPGFRRIMHILRKHYLVLSILIAAAIIRFYRIGDYMTFLGDEGRDMLVALHILKGDITFLGPRASAGDFFLGPIYYYFITPFLWLFQYDPVGPAVMVALFGIATVFLVYFVGAKFYSKTAGIIAALLYALSPIVVRYSMSSWNPNVVPFFTILAMYIMYSAIESSSKIRFLILGLLLGILIQLHYLATFIGVIVFLYIAIGSYLKMHDAIAQFLKKLVVRYVVVFIGFILTLSPFIAFEIRHGFPNTRSIFAFIFSVEQNSSEGTRLPYLQIVEDVYMRIWTKVFVNIQSDFFNDSQIGPSLMGVLLVISLIAIAYSVKTKKKLQSILILVWLITGILLFGLYKKNIFEYYFAFLFPLPFLIYGNLAKIIFNMKGPLSWLRRGVVIFTTIAFVAINIYGLHIWNEPNRQKQQMQQISDFVLEQTNGKPFNFALITGGNSDHAYRYFFEIQDRVPVVIENEMIDPERNTVTDQLLIVCEEECSPLGHPLWEVAGFGKAKIVGEWDVSVSKVYKLVPETNTQD